MAFVARSLKTAIKPYLYDDRKMTGREARWTDHQCLGLTSVLWQDTGTPRGCLLPGPGCGVLNISVSRVEACPRPAMQMNPPAAGEHGDGGPPGSAAA